MLLVLIFYDKRKDIRVFHNIWARLVASLGVFSGNFEVFKRLLFTTIAVIRLNFVVTVELEVITQLNDLSALLN